MESPDGEETRLRSVALQNAQSILNARIRAEEELVRAKEALERRSNELAHSLAMLRATLDSTTDGILVTNGSGTILDYNEVVVAMWQVPKAVMELRDHRRVLEFTSRYLANPKTFLAAVEAIYAGSPPESHDLLELTDGRAIERSSRIQYVAGQNVGRVWNFRDVTEQRRSVDARARLAAIVESSDDAIVGKTMGGIIMSWNAAAERLFGYSAAETIGQPITMLIPPDLQEEEQMIIERLRRGERTQHFETVRLTKHGQRIDVSLAISPIRDNEGTLIGASKIARDITARKRADAELAAAHAALRAADRAKDDFLATLAHELRNPLAPIRNALYILQKLGALPTEGAWATGIIDRQVGQLTRLVEDLLDLARITSNKLELRPRPLDLNDVVQLAVEASRPRIDARSQTLEVLGSDAPIPLDGDPARLAQAVSNLLNNAAKYTDPGGRIQVAIVREGGEAIVTVRDTGVGIPREMLATIFEMFTQVDRSVDRSDGGLGIGLALVKRIVEMHGGTVAVESDGPGKGSTFSVRLPI